MSEENKQIDSMEFSKDDAYKTLDTVNMWINNCDTKVSIILGIYGVLISIFLSSDYVSKILELLHKAIDNPSFCDISYLVVLSFSVALFLIGLCNLIRVIVPRIILGTNKKTGNDKFDSIMFYGSIAQIESFDKYCEKVNTVDDSKILKDLLFQIYSASDICNKKFRRQKSGVLFSLVGIAFFAGMIVIGYMVYL